MNSLVPKVLFHQHPIHKRNESPDNCQDSCAVNQFLHRFAVADGVGSTFYPAHWAKLLVEHFVYDRTSILHLDQEKERQLWLNPIQQKWKDIVGEVVHRRIDEPAADHIRTAYKKQDPAGATFVGLQITQAQWCAMIIGDSCLFHLTKGNVECYPLQRSSDFDNATDYFSSVAGENNLKPKFRKGKINEGDYFFLATDALSKWLLQRYEMGGDVWKQTWQDVVKLESWEDLYHFANQARQNPDKLDDDDVALIVIQIVQDRNPQSSTGGLTDFSSTARKPDANPKPFITRSSQPVLQQPVSLQSEAPITIPKPGEDLGKIVLQTRKYSKFAALFSLLVLLMSVTSIYLSVMNFSPTSLSIAEPTPILANTSIQGTYLPSASTVTPMQLPAFHALSPNTVIHERPNISSNQLLLVTSQSQFTLTTVLTSTGQTWAYVELDLWIPVSEHPDGIIYLSDDRSVFTLRTPITARLHPLDLLDLAILQPNTVYQKTDEFYSDATGVLYKLKLSGFVTAWK